MTILRKSILLAIAATSFVSIADAQTLFTYGTTPVSKAEFLKAFNKNNAGQEATPQAYKDYLDLYSKFKLKVKAAKDLKLDTLANQKAELAGFKSQVAEGFMNDEATINALTKEALVRGQKEIHLAHIFIPLSAQTSPVEIKAASSAIQAAYDALTKGESFESVATTYSKDPAVLSNKGDIGWITAFTLTYELENLAYKTPAKTFSKPYESKLGFHIFRNIEERESSGRLRAAQILFAFRPNATDAQKAELKQRADSVYKAIIGGADFKTLAATFSDDNISYQTGGEMMEFGVGRYDPVFEKAAFGLAKDNDVTQPFETSFGYHIIKRLELKPALKSIEVTRDRDALKQQVYQSDRMEYARKSQNAKIRQQLGYKRGVYNDAFLWRATDSILRNRPIPANTALTANTVLFTFKDKKVVVKDWQEYLTVVKGAKVNLSKETIYEEFINQKLFDYYRDHLADYNPDFAFQVEEFREGNLLFEVMQRKIWDKAAADSAGLKKYYEQQKEKYKWEASADAVIFTFMNAELAEKMRPKIEADWKSWIKYAEESDGQLQADSSRFELSQIPVPDRTNFQPGLLTATTKNENDNSVSYTYIIKLYPAGEQRDFRAARGFVINDYQSYLEEKWVAELKKKYPVKVNDAVLKGL
ncbi:MAG: peptidylprolyl isomerase [Flavitalea sp.]